MNKFYYQFLLYLLVSYSLIFIPDSFATPQKKVGLIQVAEHPALNAARNGIIDQLISDGYISNKSLILLYDSAQGNPVLASQIAQKFVDKNSDIIVSIGTNSSQLAISAAKAKKIPVVFTAVTDPLGSKLVNNLEKPNTNVTGVSDKTNTLEQFLVFKSILPSLKKIGTIFNPGEQNSVILVNEMQEVAKKTGLELVASPAMRSSEVPSAAEALISKVQAIFINNDNTALSAFKSIVTIGHRHHVPVFSSDTDSIEQGALAVLGPNQYQLGKQTGKMVVKILNGNKPCTIPVEFPEKNELHLNENSAKMLNITFSPEVLKKATRIYTDTK